jgi:DsbC/DsbD-like thiol-disulfide interchange protein
MKKLLKVIAFCGLLFSKNLNALNKNNTASEQDIKFIINKYIKTNDHLVKFDLNIEIPKGYKIYSNEKQDIGKPLSITIEEPNEIDTPEANIKIDFPKSQLDSVDGKTNHIYKENINIPILITNLQQINKNLLIDYTMCGEDKCLNKKHTIDFSQTTK